MIFKLIPRGENSSRERAGTRIRRLLAYIGNPQTEDGNEKCHYTTFFNLLSGKKETALNEFLAAGYVPDCTMDKCAPARNSGALIDHCVISWKEEETPTIENINTTAKIFTATYDKDAICMAGVHVNTENLHLHLAVQRYDPFGKLFQSNDRPNPLRVWHANLTILEHRLGFLSEPNAMFSIKKNENGIYILNPRQTEKSRNWIKPVDSQFFPVLTCPTPIVAWPKKIGKKEKFYYYEGIKNPIIYEAKKNIYVLLQWRRPEIFDSIFALMEKNKNIVIHNICETKKSTQLNMSNVLIPTESYVPDFPKKPPKNENIKDQFIAINKNFSKDLHPTIRETYTALELFKKGFPRDEIGECLEKFSQTKKDSLFPLHIARALNFGLKPTNRFKRLEEQQTSGGIRSWIKQRLSKSPGMHSQIKKILHGKQRNKQTTSQTPSIEITPTLEM